MEWVVVFIDDSSFEHELVQDEIAPCAGDARFVQAYTFDEALEKLGASVPSIFLLDLWGKDESITEPRVMSREEIENRVERFPSLGSVYRGLGDFEGDGGNEYLKRFFSIIDSWRSLFEEVCACVGQNRKYGLSNLLRARDVYPGVPAVFYTRKSLISDAVALFEAGADGLFIKPTGRDGEETRRLTREKAPELIAKLRKMACNLP